MTELLAEPLVGWRRARIHADDNPYGPFQSLTSLQRFGVEGTATCRNQPTHEVDPWVRFALDGLEWEAGQIADTDLADAARRVVKGFRKHIDRAPGLERIAHDVPNRRCWCGFYAMSRRCDVPGRVAQMGDWPPGDVLLEVEMFGRYVRHELGNRSERQRVIGVYLPPLRTCGHPQGNRFTVGWNDGGQLSTCRACDPRSAELYEQSLAAGVRIAPTFTPAELAERVGTEVSWGEDSDWPERRRRRDAPVDENGDVVDPRHRGHLRACAYGAAQGTVRDAHRDEFDAERQRLQEDGCYYSLAYSAALRNLRERYRDEFDEAYAAELARYGMEPGR